MFMLVPAASQLTPEVNIAPLTNCGQFDNGDFSTEVTYSSSDQDSDSSDNENTTQGQERCEVGERCEDSLPAPAELFPSYSVKDGLFQQNQSWELLDSGKTNQDGFAEFERSVFYD